MKLGDGKSLNRELEYLPPVCFPATNKSSTGTPVFLGFFTSLFHPVLLGGKKRASTVNQCLLWLKGSELISVPLKEAETVTKGRLRNCCLVSGTSLVFLVEPLKDSSKYFWLVFKGLRQ